MDWDDLRFILAVGREGSVAGAARRLGCHQATVFRRLAAIEAAAGDRLFERRPDGYLPTPLGRRMADAAERIEAEVAAVGRQVAAGEARPRGTVRLTTTDTLLDLLMPHLRRFREVQPEIVVHLTAADRFVDLSRDDADVAIRPAANPPPALVGRRLAAIAHALYGSRDYLARSGAERGFDDHAWIGLDDALAHLASARWLRSAAPVERIHHRVNTITAALAAAAAGLGLAVLPCYLGDSTPGLERVGGPIDACAGELWLLTHPGLRRVPRVRALLDFIAPAIARQRPMLEGRARAR